MPRYRWLDRWAEREQDKFDRKRETPPRPVPTWARKLNRANLRVARFFMWFLVVMGVGSFVGGFVNLAHGHFAYAFLGWLWGAFLVAFNLTMLRNLSVKTEREPPESSTAV